MSLFVFKNKRKAIFLSVLFGIVGISFINSTVADASDTYYLGRKAELDSLYPSSSTVKFPMIVKTMNTSDSPYTQYITFGAFDKDKKEPYSISDAFGTTVGSIQGNPFVNIVNEMAPGDFSSSVADAFSKKNDSSGLAVQLGSSNTVMAPRLEFFSNKTSSYSFRNDNGKDVIKLLGNAKGEGGADYTVEQTIVSDPNDPEVEVTAKVTNATDKVANFAVSYGFSSEIKVSGMATLSNTFSHYKDMEGFYSEAPMDDLTKVVSSKVKFPKDLSEVPDDWALQYSEYGGIPYRTYKGFSDDRHPKPYSVFGKGMAAGFTQSEIKGKKSYADLGAPYLDREPARPHNFNKVPITGVSMKRNPVNIANGKDFSLRWKTSFTEEKIKRAENSIYNEFDKESGTSLENFNLISKIPPLEVNTSSLDDITEVKNFLIFGNQDTDRDTLPQIKSGIQSQLPNLNDTSALQSDINKSYRTSLNLGINTPRVITYKKNSVNDKVTSYSHQYAINANSNAYGGSGLGLATFENGNVRVPVSYKKASAGGPDGNYDISAVNSSILDEVYRSKDGKTLKLYGRYLMGNGTWIPMSTTVSNIGSIGKVRITFQYQNKLGFKTDFNSFFSNHMDINGQHANSKMLTLGDMNGIFFNQKGLTELGPNSNYFVAFYTYNSNKGRAPKTIITTSYGNYGSAYPGNLPEDTGHSITYPRNWDVVGEKGDMYTPAFYQGQAKGKEIERRDYKTGALKPGNIRYAHPGWSFIYSPEPLDVDKVGSSTLEMKVSDIPDINYSGVKISPESNKVITKKEDLVIKPTYTQKLDSPVSNQYYKPEFLEIFIPTDSYPKARDNQYKVSMDGKALVENVDYQKYIDNTTNSTVIKLMDKFLWDNKEEGKDIRKDVVVEQIFDIGSSQEIVKFYDKSTNKFTFDLKSYNAFKIANSEDPKEEQNPQTNAKQNVSYVPDFSAVAKTNTGVSSGTIAPNDPSEFLTLSYNKVFDFDNLEVNYENNVKPVFQGDGTVKFNVVVQSKSFGNPKTVPVEVKVSSNVEMTVHRYLNEKDGTKTNKIKNLKDGSLNDISESPTKVKKLDNFNDILNKLKNDPFLGYEYVSLVVKLKDGTVINDTSKVPESDFVVDLYYKGQVLLDSPQSFDFGEHKLDVRGSSQIEPIISKDGNTDKTKTKMQVINTQGNGSGWKLYASQTKEMKKGNTTFKGSLYYIPKAGDTPIIIDKIAKPINPIEKSKDAAIVNSIPLQSVDANNKTGILVDIYPGNQLGDYTSGEVTWNLQDAL